MKIKSLVATLVTRCSKKGGHEALMGEKIGGALEGFINMPGGHIEQEDVGIIAASNRECWEETNLRCTHTKTVARLTVWRKEEGKKIIVHVIHCSSFTGKVRRDPSEFKFLRWYHFDSMPWDLMAPKDKEWMEKLIKGLWNDSRMLHATIHCEKNRTDVRKITTRRKSR